MEGWPCDQCTFSNHTDAKRCEMCDATRERSGTSSDICFIDLDDPSTEASPAGVRNDSPHITCLACSFDNDADAIQCAVCEDTAAFADAYVGPSASLPQNGEVVSCRNCYVKFPSSSGSTSNSSDQRKSNNCPNCGSSLNKSSRAMSYPYQNGYGKSERIYQTVTEGVIELMTTALTENGLYLPSGPFSKKLTIEYSICSPCPHVSQRGNEGFEWSCGYRNIQMICHSLLNSSVDGYKSYESQLFNGKGDVPDIAGIQSWIEKAWKAGFDVPGGEEFEGSLCGTEHWIGATECAAFLRYFGIRAVIVDFSMDKEERTNRAAKLKLTLARRSKTMCNKKRRKNDEGYPPKKYVKNKNIKISHSQSTTTVAAIDTNNNIDIDRYDNQSDDDFEKDDDVAISLNGNGIKNDSSVHRDASIESNSTSEHLNPDVLINQEKHDDMNKIDEDDEISSMSMSEGVFNWVKRYHALNKVITNAGSVALGGGVSCNQIKRSVSVPRNKVINIDLEDDDDNNDNNSKNNNSNNSNNAAKSDNDNDKSKVKYSSVLPLFFQHQGHSRTIIGYEISATRGMINEKEEKNNSTFKKKNSNMSNSQSNNDGGNLEEVQSLLVFDPLSDGLAIKNSLLNNTNSWKSHLKRGRHTLTKNSYQIVYIAKGIMSEEEQERSKVLIGQSDFADFLTEI